MLRQGGTLLISRLCNCSKATNVAGLPELPALLLNNSARESAASVSSWLMRSWQDSHAGFHSTSPADIQSTGQPPEREEAPHAARPRTEEDSTSADSVADAYANLNVEDLQKLLAERDLSLNTGLAQVDELTDQLKRTLADMENLRQRSARQAEQTKKFAVQGFLKSMLDVGDNLERAYSTVPQQALEGLDQSGRPLSSEDAVKLLIGLVNGVKLTEKIFDQGLKANAVEKIRPLGQKFDPNLHEALFEMADCTKEPGTVGAITKTGYLLQGRVVRPAQVGVYKKP